MNAVLWAVCAGLVLLALIQLLTDRDVASAAVLFGLALLIGPVGVWLMRNA